MLPIQIKIQGFYSYQSTQTIDFRSLTNAGLFGIFGKVGSGKSSILEAMMFALYGELERLDTKGRAYNMMNLNSQTLLIEFIFSVKNLTYKSVVKSARNKKRFEEVKTENPKFYALADPESDPTTSEDWTVLADFDAQKIIGLKPDDFRKTVIIPQNRFQDFLQLTDTDRTRMLKGLFNLDRFELDEKTRKLERQNDSQIQTLQGGLAVLGDISSETLKMQQAVLTQTQADIAQLQQQIEAKNTLATTLLTLQQQTTQLQKWQSEQQALQLRSDEMQALKTDLAKIAEAMQVFKNTVEQKQQLENELDTQHKTQETLTKHQVILQAQATEAQTALDNIRVAYEEREQLTRQSEALQQLVIVRQQKAEAEAIEIRLQKGENLITKQKNALQTLIINAAQMTAQQQATRQEMPDFEQLHALQNWFREQQFLIAEQQRFDSEIQVLSAKLKAIETGKIAVLTKLSASFEIPMDTNMRVSEAITQVKKLRETTQKNIETLDHELTHLQATSQLEDLASNLHEGDPCPLCGATHHLEVINIADTKKAIAAKESQRKKLQTQTKTLENILAELNTKLQSFNTDNEALKVTEKKRLQQQEKVQNHVRQFVWQDKFSILDEKSVQNTLHLYERLQKTLKDLEQNLVKNTTEQTTVRQELDKFDNAKQILREQMTTLKTTIETQTKQSASDIWAQFDAANDPAVLTHSKALQQQRAHLETQYQQYDQTQRTATEQLQNIIGQSETLQTNIKNLLTKYDELMQSLEKLLQQSTYFSVLIEVQDVLVQKFDIENSKKILAEYENQQRLLESQIQEMQMQLDGKSYDAIVHEALKMELTDLRAQLDAQIQSVGQLKSEIQTLDTKLKQARKIKKELTQLETRAEHLKVLKSIFAKSGFVNFMSSEYLRNLCQAADERFRQLTSQQLRLELDSENRFILRDMLNNGQTRSLKTLSGGQSFQASLCLALALADNIQVLTQQTQNFFFLDEGFGSLDRDALQIVFDTLKDLRKEQRIVGIISHVEEMQQEIEHYVQVVLDPQAGSLVALV